ncbi:MAG: hypothetical protein ACJ77K_15310 [Bacteroidia bacterium]
MKKVHEWELWDWKTILGIPAFLGGLILLFYLFSIMPDYFRSRHSRNYSAHTNARMVRWQGINTVSQGHSGQTIITTGYQIVFDYRVNDQYYLEQDKIPSSEQNDKFLSKLFGNEISGLSIKYDPSDPSHSQINTDSIFLNK